MVDTKGVRQLFTLKGGADDDFGEWTHKVRTFMLARFGDEILAALTWAAEEPHDILEHCFRRSSRRRRDRETSMTLLENFTPTLCPLQPTSKTLEKEMAWKPGDDCTASTTRHRP